MPIGGYGAPRKQKEPLYAPARKCSLCRRTEKKHPGARGCKVVLQTIPAGTEWFDGDVIEGIWCKRCQGQARRRRAGRAQPAVRGDIIHGICVPVSPKLVLAHNGASATPLELLASGTKYICIIVNGEAMWFAAEAVSCGGTSHLLRSGCLLTKEATKQAKQKARAGRFVALEPRAPFFAVHNKDKGRVLGKHPEVHGRMQPVGMIYAVSAERLDSSFTCPPTDNAALCCAQRQDPRSRKAVSCSEQRDVVARAHTGSIDARYQWERSDALYKVATKKRAASGRYFFLAPTWLPHEEYVCTYRLSKGKKANGYTDGIFKRVG